MLSSQSAALLGIVAAIAVIASILTYQYSNSIASQAIAISAQDVRSNSEITAHDLARVLENKIGGVVDNLQIIATSQAVKEENIQRAEGLFESAHESTSEFTDSYFWVNKNGALLWANAFSNETLYQQYKGADRSQRSYYLEPEQTHEPFVSAVIESVDGVPRLYAAYPIMVDDQTSGGKSFNGVIVAASNLDEIGLFLKGELSPKMQSNIGLTDIRGTILYTQTESIIGKDVFGPETQAILPPEMRDTFNSIVRDAISGNAGSGDFSYQGATTTIAYQPVSTGEQDFGVLYVITPHALAGNTAALIDQQRNAGIIMILIIGAVAAGIALLILGWNKNLKKTVAEKTEELRQSNESLKTAVDQLKVHDKLQQEFINVAAHELRTPIQPILGVSELINLDFARMPDKNQLPIDRESAEMIFRNAKRLERLSSDILQVTRIEGNRLSLQKEVFDLNIKVRDVVHDIEASLPAQDRKKISINLNLHKMPLNVEADKPKIYEAVANLLTNAIKFTRAAASDGIIRIDTEIAENGKNNDSPFALFRITDNGMGIDATIMPRLFTKFATKSDQGTGLGLYITKSIIEAHGGRIWAENNPDGGAVFAFTLPLATKSTEGKQDTPESAMAHTTGMKRGETNR